MKRRNFLKTHLTAAMALTGGRILAAENGEDAKKWQITQKMPLPKPHFPQAIFAAAGQLWVLTQTAILHYEAEKWIPYAENLPGTAWCFCVTTAEDGKTRVYVGLQDAKTKKAAIHVLEDGKTREIWTDGLTAANRLTDITVAEDDNGDTAIFVADAGNRNILRYDAAGKFLHKLYKTGQLIVPSPYLATCVGRDGLLCVANPGRFCVEAFYIYADRTPQEKAFTWGTAGSRPEQFAGCCNPAWLTVTAGGDFLTSEKRFLRVKLHDPEGKFLTVLPLPPIARNAVPEGFPVAADGEFIYLLDPRAKMVYGYQQK